MWRVLSESGTLRAVMVYDAGWSMWGLKLPFSGEHQLCWYTSKNVSYDESESQYRHFIRLLSSEGAEVLDISHIVRRVLEESTNAERKEIVKIVWGGKKQRPSLGKLTPESVMLGYPPYPEYKGGRVITPDFVRANTYARDIGFNTQGGLVISRMRGYSRREQPRLVKLVAKYDRVLSKNLSVLWDADDDAEAIGMEAAIEGGDVQILDEGTIACGIGQQTNMAGFTMFAKKILHSDSGVRRVIGVRLPQSPASIYMHLDTTVCFYGKRAAVVMPYIHESRTVKRMPPRALLLKLVDSLRADLTRDGRHVDTTPSRRAFEGVGRCTIIEEGKSGPRRREAPSFIDYMIEEGYLDQEKIALVGGDPERPDDVKHLVRALREQYTQAPNIVCLKEKVVLGYERNRATLGALKRAGAEVRVIPDAFLDMGGGPHCLTMPLARDA